MFTVDPQLVLEILLISIIAGVVGALFGLGGGILVIPFLTLVEGVPVQLAVGASIVSVVATSSASAATYVKDHLTNLRLGMFLETGTVAGALTGAFVASYFQGPNEWILYVLFGSMLFYASTIMISGRRVDFPRGVTPDRLAKSLDLGGEYSDQSTGTHVKYAVTRTPHTLGISYLAGIVSGLLGVGGGIIKVPTMNLVSKVPVKVASATSNFMIGITAAASATIYFLRGDVHPLLTAPLMIGVVVGAAVGTRLLRRTPPTTIKILFAILLVFVALNMVFRGLSIQMG